jgi:outer membrane protein
MKNRLVLSALLAGSTLFVSSASAAPFGGTIGVGAGYSPEIYTGIESETQVIPVLGYEGEHLYWRGLSLGYQLNPRGSQHNLAFHVDYKFAAFDPDDSDNTDIRKLDERDDFVLGGVTYRYRSMAGVYELTGMADISGAHDGWLGEVAWRFPIRQQQWGLTPSVGYTYYSDDYNQYLYGVTAQESARTGGTISAFSPGAEGEFFAGLRAYYSLTETLMVSLGVKYTALQGDIEESPILEKDHYTSGMGSIIYRF